MSCKIIVPMAGEGSRFVARGYSFPKPLIQMPDGNPMIKMVIDCLGIRNVEWHFIVKSEHENQYRLSEILPRMVQNLKPKAVYVHPLHEKTEGAACTLLSIKHIINRDDPILVCNADQYFEWDPNDFGAKIQPSNVDGAILTFKSSHPKWSFVQIQDGRITRVAEKMPISDDASVGVYYWRRGSDFVRSAEEMIQIGQRVNGEFYVMPTYNKLIQRGANIIPYAVTNMQGVGTPEDLHKFEIKYYVKEAIKEA